MRSRTWVKVAAFMKDLSTSTVHIYRDVLVTGNELGVIGVYADASQLQDDDEPTVILWAIDGKAVVQVRAVQR